MKHSQLIIAMMYLIPALMLAHVAAAPATSHKAQTSITIAQIPVMDDVDHVPTTPGPWSNDCLGWAQMLGKEGIVHDSISMHLLGCDDDRYGAANAHYHATYDYNRDDYCTKRARQYARAGWFSMPWSIAKHVNWDLPFCTVYEDGSYSAGYWEADDGA